MSRLLKALVYVVVALALAGAPMVASAAPVREQGVVSMLEGAWARVLELWSGVVGAEKGETHAGNAPAPAVVACSTDSCSPPIGSNLDNGPELDPNG